MKYPINRLASVIVLLYTGTAAAQTPVYDLEQLQRSGFSFSIAPLIQGSSDIDGGGSYSMSSLLIRISATKPVSTRTFVGFGISYGITKYDFENPSAFNGQQPWNDIRSLNFSLPVVFRTDNNWTFVATPSIGTFQEVDADWRDSLTYGAILIGSYNFERGNRIGIGLGAFDRLDETALFPFLSVKWQLTDNLRIGNALNAGPTGPAGLQLAYRFSEKWEAAIGFSRRSFRFRLDDTGLAPGGIGTQDGRLLFLRLSTNLTPTMHLDLHAGINHDGNLILENNENTPVASADYEAVPLLALNLSGRF